MKLLRALKIGLASPVSGIDTKSIADSIDRIRDIKPLGYTVDEDKPAIKDRVIFKWLFIDYGRIGKLSELRLFGFVVYERVACLHEFFGLFGFKFGCTK